MLILHKEKLLCREDIKLMEEVKSLYINFSFEFSVFHLTGVALAIYIKVMLLFSQPSNCNKTKEELQKLNFSIYSWTIYSQSINIWTLFFTCFLFLYFLTWLSQREKKIYFRLSYSFCSIQYCEKVVFLLQNCFTQYLYFADDLI